MYELIKWDQKCNSVGFEWKERLDEHNAVAEVVKNHSVVFVVPAWAPGVVFKV